MKKLIEGVEHDLVCPDCGSLDIGNHKGDPSYYKCRDCGNIFHEDEAVEYCDYYESVNLNINKLNSKLIEAMSALTPDQPTQKKDGRSFIHYIKYHAKNNQIDWENAYKDENDGYKWYLPLKYNFNAEKVAPAIKRNLRSGKLDVNAKLLPYTGDVDAPRVVELTFRNKKKEREDSEYTWIPESIKDINGIIETFLNPIDEEAKLYYLGYRQNPQLDKGYYKEFGQLTKKEAKDKENCVYGTMSLRGFKTEEEYKAEIEKVKEEGYSVR